MNAPVIDIHSHFFPRLSRAEARRYGGQWPWLREEGDGCGCIMQGDKEFRPVREVLWDPAVRLAELARHGIDRQIISATPILFGYGADVSEAAEAAERINDLALEFCAAGPSRLKALCQVPLQDLRRSCDELDRSMARGHVGVQIGNHVGDRDLDDGQLIEFLQHCGDVGAPVLVHPWDMFGRERMDRYMLQWLVGMPAETQLSILYLILSGAFERLPPDLKICFAHGGGSFAYLLGRVDNAWERRDIVRRDCPRRPSCYVDRFMTDSIVFDEQALSLLIGTMGVERVMFGTDHPFPLGEQTPGRLIQEHAALAPDQRRKLLYANAAEFFGLIEQPTVAGGNNIFK
jgi:aminocarboxymuconate-semialdehyde decarboxylase